MKKVFLSAIMATLLITSSFASGTKKLNSKVTDSFKARFQTADEIEWTVKEDFIKVNFTENGKRHEAFYDNSGELISTSTRINIDDLPAATKRSFAKKYDGYTVKEAVKMESADETAYYLSVEKEQRSLILKVANGSISIFKVK